MQSAFGHAGQKCSAASLAIVVRDVYEDPAFLRQLADAVREPSRRSELGTLDLASGRSSAAPNRRSNARSTTSIPARVGWSQPCPLDAAGLQWSPGVKLGVQSGSWSHQHEWFGPVLGVMVAPGLRDRHQVAEPDRLRTHRRTPVTRRGRVRAVDATESRPGTST